MYLQSNAICSTSMSLCVCACLCVFVCKALINLSMAFLLPYDVLIVCLCFGFIYLNTHPIITLAYMQLHKSNLPFISWH